MLSLTLLPLFAVLASCAAPPAGSQISDCPPLPTYDVPAYFRPGVKWQIEIQDPIMVPPSPDSVIPADAKVWDIDLLKSIEYNVIPRLRAANQAANGEIFVICYFNAGGYNESEPDTVKLNPEDKLGKIPGWDEHYLDIMNSNVINLMKQRIDNGIAAGCNGFDPDNIDGYENPESVMRKVANHTLNASDYYDYVKELASYAHARNTLLGQKNARDLLDLGDGRGLLKDGIVDFAVTEECAVADPDDPEEAPAWCNDMQPFIDCSKPVFQIEYPSEWNQQTCAAPALDAGARATYCSPWTDQKFSTILKLNGDGCGLNGVTQYCDQDEIVTTPTMPEDPEE
ncbi:extracellular protein [Apiospora sp. TS-2023a]